MKQYIILNNTLKMSKGKMCRVCAMLGSNSRFLETEEILSKWAENYFTTIVLKSNYYEEHKKLLDEVNIKYTEHVDLGLTQVPVGSKCGIVFFTNKNINWIKELKLV